MQFKLFLVFLAVGAVLGKEESGEKQRETICRECQIELEEAKKDHHDRKEEIKKEHDQEWSPSSDKKTGFKLDDKTKSVLTDDKVSQPEFIFEKMLEFFLKNPSRQFERDCYAKIKPGQSVDFVIDIAPSPADDKLDRIAAESPLAYYLTVKHEAVSPAYFNAIQHFIDAVTFGMKPEATHAVIYNDGRKFVIRGKETRAPISAALSGARGDFSDAKRGLKTMWPVASKVSVKETSILSSVVKNNLGRMTKLALWNRDNGLPTVLSSTRRSKPVYTILITDGASGAKIADLVDDVTTTTVIDIGDRRFVKNLEWNDMHRLVNLVSLNAPQQLMAVVETCRFTAVRACGC